jgi:hypothetical protein
VTRLPSLPSSHADPTRRVYEDAAAACLRRWDRRSYRRPALLTELLRELPGGGRILDLGCGPGQDARRLKAGGHPVVGLDFSASLLVHARRKGRHPRTHIEQEIMGLTHAEVAGWLGTQWHLPVTLRDPMMFHHHPALSRDAEVQTAIVHVADVLVKALGCGDSGDDLVPPLHPKAWAMLKLDEAAVTACLAKAAEEFETIDDYL